ncbi:MAG: hypothetical protein PHX78_09535 [bacterium]|nr:hypothetical protein [bacterium]
MDKIFFKNNYVILKIIFLILTFQSAIYSNPLENWQWRKPAPTGADLKEIVFGKDIFVAIGEGGTIITSSNGVNWVVRKSGTFEDLNKIIYENNIFIIAGNKGVLLKSFDGINWEKKEININENLEGIACGKDKFVVLGREGTILESSDAINWKIKKIEINKIKDYEDENIYYKDIVFLKDKFIVIGDIGISSGIVLYSNNAEEWTINKDLSLKDLIYKIVYINDKFVAYGGYRSYISTYYSDDFMKWNSGDSEFGYFGSIIRVNDSFYGVASTEITISNDCINWSAIYKCKWDNERLESIAYGNNTFVTVGENGLVIISKDGKAWEKISSDRESIINRIIYNNNLFVTVGFSGSILTSTDAKEWITRTSGLKEALRDVIYANGKFIAVGDSGTVISSSDGVNWMKIESGTAANLYKIIFNDDKFIIIGGNMFEFKRNSVCLTSNDGLKWDLLWPNIQYTSVSFINKIFIEIINHTLYKSSDAINWVPFSIIDKGKIPSIASIIHAKDKFIGMGSDGKLFFSSDGSSWKYGQNEIAQGVKDFSALIFQNEKYYAFTKYGQIYSSEDGSNWSGITYLHFNIRDIIYAQKTFILVGDKGIIQSDIVE